MEDLEINKDNSVDEKISYNLMVLCQLTLMNKIL